MIVGTAAIASAFYRLPPHLGHPHIGHPGSLLLIYQIADRVTRLH